MCRRAPDVDLMNEVLACRGCHHALASDAGCALCLSVKPHLVVTSAIDEDAVPLATVATEAVGVLRKQLFQLKNMAKLSPSYDAVVSGEARAVANTIAKLLDSARKVVQDGADAVGAMSFQERLALFMEWTGSLPGAYRRKLIDQLLTQNQAKLDSAADASSPAESDGSDVIVN